MGQQFSSTFGRIESQFEKLERRNDVLESKNIELQKRWQHANRENVSNAKKISLLQRELADSDVKICKLQRELDATKQENIEFREAITEFREQLRTLDSRIPPVSYR